jgi:hypothetical protein
VTVPLVVDVIQGHKFECDPEEGCAETVKNTVRVVVNFGEDIVIPFT